VRRPRCGAALLAALGSLVLLSGCGLTHLQDLQFRADTRLHFLAPKDRAEVHQPVTVSWTMRDFTIEAPGSAPPSRDAGYFAVFVDRQPIRPGHTMKDVATDEYCKRNPRCPDANYLASKQIYPTTKTSIKLPTIAVLTNHETLQMHTITVVLMDTSGHRIGESAWELDVRIRKATF